jgi:hypothetical protein
MSRGDVEAGLENAERALSGMTSSGISHIPSESMKTFRREPSTVTLITTPLSLLLLLLLDLRSPAFAALVLLLLRCAELVPPYRPLGPLPLPLLLLYMA